MIGLILKDLFSLKKQLKYYLLAMLFYIGYSVYMKETTMLMMVCCLFSFMIPLNTFTCDEAVNWNQYAFSMPVSVEKIVLSKYCLNFILQFLGLLLYTITLVVVIFSNDTNEILSNMTSSVIRSSTISICISFLFIGVTFPIIYKYGVERARIVMMFLFVAPAMLGMLVIKNSDIMLWLKDQEVIVKFGMIGFILVSILVIFSSILISVSIMKKKEL